MREKLPIKVKVVKSCSKLEETLCNNIPQSGCPVSLKEASDPKWTIHIYNDFLQKHR